MMTKKPKTEKMQAEIAAAKAKLADAKAKSDAMENAGEVDEKTVNALTKTMAECRLMAGQIRRLEGELPAIELAECQSEVARLMQVAQDEQAAARKQAAALVEKACKILLPEVDSHPAWDANACNRRRHEIALLAESHPLARIHTDNDRQARSEVDGLYARIRELKS